MPPDSGELDRIVSRGGGGNTTYPGHLRAAADLGCRQARGLSHSGPVRTARIRGALPVRDHAPAALVVLLAALASGCASSGAVPRPFPVPGAPPARSTPPAAAPFELRGLALADTALSLRGVPYRPGGSDPSGFDCSGLVHYVLAQHGVWAPRVVRDQYALGRAVGSADLQPGDLLFFRTEGRQVSHVGIAIDGERFVHAPSARGVVRVESVRSEYWSRRFAGARRIEEP